MTQKELQGRLYCFKSGNECVGLMCKTFWRCKQRKDYDKENENEIDKRYER